MSYRSIYVCLDNSEPSLAAMQRAIDIAKRGGARTHLTGSHVYAAKLHDRRFRAMESGLPSEFRKEEQLEHQRDVHDTLITQGLEMITDAYLAVMEGACKRDGLPFDGVSLEGKNWQALVRDIDAGDHDLVALGAHGLGAVNGALLGSVAERVLRRVKRDLLVCRPRDSDSASDRIAVCLDGSPRSWGALQRGIELAKLLDKQLEAVAVYDPHFHHGVFRSIDEVLSDEARQVFRFEDQERLHEEIIDSGLARIYRSHLEIAQRIGGDEGLDIETHLLEGKPFPEILAFTRRRPPSLLVLGRLGIHSDEEMDIGSQTENLVRAADVDVLVVDSKFEPPVEYLATATVTWAPEALAKMNAVPERVRGMAMRAIESQCIADGHTVVTSSVVLATMEALRPSATGADDAGMPWSDEATARMEGVPAGFMRHAARKAVEAHAKNNGLPEVTLAVVEEELARIREHLTGQDPPVEGRET